MAAPLNWQDVSQGVNVDVNTAVDEHLVVEDTSELPEHILDFLRNRTDIATSPFRAEVLASWRDPDPFFWI